MAESSAAVGARLVWSVDALVRAVADALSARFGACTVRGEIVALSRPGSGHCYFSLHDAGGAALLRCAMFRRNAVLIDFVPRDGQLVEVRGRLAVYEPRGELQFIVEAMRPAGDGALLERFLRLKARLEAEGLFDAARKRPLPAFPRSVGVVTSVDAAALRDVAAAFARRAPHIRVIVYPSPVQGTDAPAALVDALQRAARRAEVDLLLVCRGGGSLEDLWAFNDERVVRAIAALPMPSISGVGHETDVTLADFAADVRAATPTAAAELAAVSNEEAGARLAGLASLLRRRIDAAQDRHAQRLDRLTLRLAKPAEVVRLRGRRVERLAERLATATRHLASRRVSQTADVGARLQRALQATLQRRAQRLELVAARARALDPQQVLTRGYAWLGGADGRPVVSIAQVEAGSKLEAVLADGRAGVRVIDVHPDARAGTDVRSKR
ncbi:MAG: exodeoxyribonuclease VII large subunit [Proteobacteria bacterium]|nr:exodeoxyribonuclease VII large subunit [Pseudomonadota bacterium]